MPICILTACSMESEIQINYKFVLSKLFHRCGLFSPILGFFALKYINIVAKKTRKFYRRRWNYNAMLHSA
uniref:Uncharacterized protein n=1 Tax=Trichobilharzia regenti TaxID=157069 RepID=A0AA85KCM3_TRIRE|nr:unnamed protein product [Trichobilharzia regenti]